MDDTEVNFVERNLTCYRKKQKTYHVLYLTRRKQWKLWLSWSSLDDLSDLESAVLQLNISNGVIVSLHLVTLLQYNCLLFIYALRWSSNMGGHAKNRDINKTLRYSPGHSDSWRWSRDGKMSSGPLNKTKQQVQKFERNINISIKNTPPSKNTSVFLYSQELYIKKRFP